MASLVFYASLCASVDDRIQLQESQLALRHDVNSPMELDLVYVIPESGFEFDPRDVGSEKVFEMGIHVFVSKRFLDWEKGAAKLTEEKFLRPVVSFKAKAVGYRLSGSLKTESKAIVTFREVGEVGEERLDE